MANFTKTEKRSNVLFDWILEERETLRQYEKLRRQIVVKDNITIDEQNLLYHYESVINNSKSMVDFCVDNIVSWHLSIDKQREFSKITEKYTKDDSNYMM